MRILLLGIGNTLLSDEGLGVKALNWLEENWQFPPEVKLLDGGTGGLALLPELSSAEVLIILDAISLGKAPGTIHCLTKEVLETISILERLSLHEVTLGDLFSLLKLKGQVPPQVYLFGIEPKSLEVGLELSREVEEALPQLGRMVLAKLSELGVPFWAKTEVSIPK